MWALCKLYVNCTSFSNSEQIPRQWNGINDENILGNHPDSEQIICTYGFKGSWLPMLQWKNILFTEGKIQWKRYLFFSKSKFRIKSHKNRLRPVPEEGWEGSSWLGKRAAKKYDSWWKKIWELAKRNMRVGAKKYDSRWKEIWEMMKRNMRAGAKKYESWSNKKLT